MVSPTRNELISELVQYVSDATGLSKELIIRGKQNAPSPIDPYCTILYVTDTPDGTHNIRISAIEDDTTQLDYAMRGKRYYTFSVQFYKTGATDLAKLLMMFPQTPNGLEFEQTSYFNVRKIESVVENATLISQNYEERASLTVELTVGEKQNLIVNRVAEVKIPLTFDSDDVIDKEIEVNNNG